MNEEKIRKQEEIEHILRCFYYSTGIQIVSYKDLKIEYSLPEKIVNAKSILNEPIETKIEDIQNEFQIIQTKYKETFLIYRLFKENRIILVGPILTEHIEQGTITNMVRDEIIPFHQKTKMQAYYDKCIVLDEIKLHYTEKLLESLLTTKQENTNIDDDVIINLQFKEDSYYDQKKNYRNQVYLHSPYIIEQEVSNTISNGDTDKAKKLLKEINRIPHAKLASNTLRSYKNSMICSCSFMTRAAIAGGVNPDDAFTLSDAYINKIETILSIKELEYFESIMLDGFTKKVKEVKAKNYSPSVLKTIYYIDDHLCEDLKIETMAKEVYLNPCYLSDIFHKETGETINSWILRKRIEEASHLVLNSNESFSNIAFFYNFCSQSYFVQCFKKIYGVTPGEYRKNKKRIS